MTPGSLAALQVDPPESLVLALMLRAEHVVSDYRTCSLTIECVLSCFALSVLLSMIGLATTFMSVSELKAL
jgi:hypothetical protein